VEDGGEEVMDTLSELHITGARSRGDGLGMGRPIWLQGRERKQAGGIGVARGTHNADSFAAMGREAGQGIDTDSFQMAGGGRRRASIPGNVAANSMQSTVHEDLASPKPKMLSSTTPSPYMSHAGSGAGGGGGGAGGGGGGAGRGRRGQSGATVGVITGSAIRSHQQQQQQQPQQPQQQVCGCRCLDAADGDALCTSDVC
jgi:hypothetical protein